MNAHGNLLRMLSLGMFTSLTLPVLTFVSLGIPLMYWLWPVDTFVRAVPLLATIWIDGAFFDGGELSPQLIPVWVALTGCLLWPLLFLGIRPRIWRARPWRYTILGYSGVALACTVPAAGWIFTHTGYLF